MSLSFSSISEYALSELPFARPVADLEIELFTDVSIAKNLPPDTVSLALNYANDVIYVVYYGGNKDSWLAPLSIDAADNVQQVFNFVDTLALSIEPIVSTSIRSNSVEISNLEVNLTSTTTTRYEIPDGIISLGVEIDSYEQPSWLISDPAVLSVDGEYFHNLRLLSNEVGVLTVEVIEKQIAEDIPSENWRDRAGLPISPISFNAIGVEQSSGPIAKSYPDISSLVLDISADEIMSASVSSVDTQILVIADNDQFAISSNVVDTGNLTTVSISDQIVFLNSEETARLDIAANDQIQQVFEFIETAEIIVETEAITSTVLGDVSFGRLSIESDSLISIAADYTTFAELTTDFEVTESKLSVYADAASLTAEPNDLISIRYQSFESSVMTINAKTFAKEYTFLQQEYADDTYELNLSAESSESFRSGAGATIRNKQFWIG